MLRGLVYHSGILCQFGRYLPPIHKREILVSAFEQLALKVDKEPW